AVDAARAYQLGLVNRVVPDARLMAEARQLAERLRAAPAASVAAAKRAVYMSEHESLERMLQYETEAQLQCFQSREARERVRAFLERRPPRAGQKAP
ncbi:MAG TPA: enoyl-CoA hydratase-related protein, partial [Pyrinomonadaceae bacterium]